MMDYASSPAPLKSKLDRVKHLLDDANKRLHEEYEIFTTKASGISTTTASNQAKQNGTGHLGNNTNKDVPMELRRTLTDISTIQSVLSCPIFGQIVNVTDSLDKLSYQLNLRPSIGPVDINIDSNGELILAPLMEHTMLNNLINNRLDEYSNLSQDSTNRMLDSEYYIQNNNNNKIIVHNNADNDMNANNDIIKSPTTASESSIIGGKKIDNKQHRFDEMDHQEQRMVQQTPKHITSVHNENYVMANDFLQSQNENINGNSTAQRYHSPNNDPDKAKTFNSQTIVRPLSGISPLQQQQLQPHQKYNTEKLVANGAADKDYVNGNRRQRSQEPSKVQSVAAAFESVIAESSDKQRLYKANGHFALNQMVPNSVDMKRDFQTTRSMSQLNEQSSMNEDSPQNLGFTNDMYRTTGELATGEVMTMYYPKQPADASNQDQNAYANNIELPNVSNGASGLVQQNRNGNGSQNNQRASPSTSAGSTVRLADECDSGTSSFRSQAAKGNLYSPQSHKPIPQLDEDSIDSSIDRDLIEKLSPEMERIKVTLEKDSNGLGITIAGYICEQEELSGLFIKSITPGSPADRSGQIKILDQIFAVNGEEILGYNNKDAVSILRRHTGRVVKLELMRYLAEAKYRKLQTLLNRAAPTASKDAVQAAAPTAEVNFMQQPTKTMGANRLSGREHSSDIPAEFTKAQPGMSTSSPKQTFLSQAAVVEAAPQQQHQLNESMYNNTSVFYEPGTGYNEQILNKCDYSLVDNQTPVAAQRGAAPTNKVIETKQGSRNTIDIRSPMCQATATYVNEISDMMFANSNVGNNRSIVDRLKQDAAEEFGNLVRSEELEWERDVQIVELYRDQSQSLGFTMKDYADPKDPQQSIFMIVSITPGGVAERDGRLSVGDLLKFVDDTNLEGASPNEAVRALKKTCGQVRIGVLKYKRDYWMHDLAQRRIPNSATELESYAD